jgi:hypothetical protein
VGLASLTGAVLIVIIGILMPKSAARALDWNVLFILSGSVALGAIVVKSGLAGVLADAVRYLSDGSVLLVVIVFAITTTLVINPHQPLQPPVESDGNTARWLHLSRFCQVRHCSRPGIGGIGRYRWLPATAAVGSQMPRNQAHFSHFSIDVPSLWHLMVCWH